MTPLFHLKYTVDIDQLLLEASEAKEKAVAYSDSRYPKLEMNDWLVAQYNSKYIQEIMDDFNVVGKPRFYWLKPHATIPTHVDNGTLCGLNFILTEEASPITFNNIDFYYKSILVNTTLPHSVQNNEKERIMLKISIFSETFDEVAEKNKKFLL